MPAWFGGYSGQGNGDWAGPWPGPSFGLGSAPTSTGGGMFSGGFGPSPYSGGNGGYGGTPPLSVRNATGGAPQVGGGFRAGGQPAAVDPNQLVQHFNVDYAPGYGPGTPGFTPFIPGGTAGAAAPSFNPYPQPNEGGTAWGSRPGLVGLPDPSGDLGRQIPGLAGLNAAASRVLAEGFAGVLPGDVIAQIQDASARFGIENGMPGSGLSRRRGLRDLGLTSLDMQRWATNAYPGFVGAVSGTQTVNPGLQAQIARDNATIASAPNPMAAANEAERLFAKYRQSTSPGGGTRGGGGGFPGFSFPGFSSPAGGTMAGPSYSPPPAPAASSGAGYGYAPPATSGWPASAWTAPGSQLSDYYPEGPTGTGYDTTGASDFFYPPLSGTDYFQPGGAPTATGNTDPFYDTFTGNTDQDFLDWTMGWGGGG